jgi:hypothetical protein
MPEKRILPCIKCGEVPESAYPQALEMGEPYNHPYAATVFYSHGQYGSTVWDEMGRDVIEINVCDKCLLEEAAKGNILRVTVRRTAVRDAVPWVPNALEELRIE